MSKVRVAGFGMSMDGFGAGVRQSLENPLGEHGPEVFRWFFGTRTFRAMVGKEGGTDDLDDQFAHRSMDNFGAFILGRNMFGPCAARGRTTRGRVGGETILHTTRPLSC